MSVKSVLSRWLKPVKSEVVKAENGLDQETLDIAKEIAFERRLKRDVGAKVKMRKFNTSADDEVTEALKGITPSVSRILGKVFERTVEDTVLANKFADTNGNKVGHLTVKKAVGMDGLRDLDDDIGVANAAASPMNPEGRFNFPTASGSHQFAERFSEAMNPVRNGRFNSVIPEPVLEHFANYSTFIGYTMCEIIGTHPTVSNACTIPGEDAIAPGYSIAFVDSDDVNKNGIPDDIERAELGGVKRALGRIEAMEGLKEAIVKLGGGDGIVSDEGMLNALAVALERLSAYEQWERERGNGEETAQAVNEGFVKPISKALEDFSARMDEKSRKDALSALSLALADMAKKEHPVLDEVRSTAARRGTVAAVCVAYEEMTRPSDEWDSESALNALAVAIERVAAYERYSDRNREVLSALTGSLSALSLRIDAESRERAVTALRDARVAMDEADFDFDEPSMDGVAAPTDDALAAAQAAETGKSAIAEQKREGRKVSLAQMKQDNEMALKKQALEMQMQQAQAQADEQRQKEEEAKRVADEKREKTKIAAEVAKERQRYLDMWKNRADDIGMNEVCVRMAKNARIFGIGIAVPVVDGVDYEKPMSLDAIHEGAYHGFTVIEPTWIYPEVESDDLVNPLSRTFFEPLYWAATGSTNIGNLGIRRIHRSWMIIVRNKELPNMLRPMYYYGGLPLTQEIYEAVYCADKVMNEVPKLAMTKRTTVVKGDPNDMVTNPEGVVSRLQAVSQVQDNFGILYVGRNADVQKLETSLSEFDQLIAKCNQRIAAIAKMPETKLFKTQLAGMNSAGRYEWDDYSQLLINIQNNWFKPLLALHYKIDTKSRTGKVIDLKISFNPIDVPTQQEKGDNESRCVQTINSAVQGGWLSAEEARTIARSREDSMFSSISADMPEELEQQKQGGGSSGMPGLQPEMSGGDIGVVMPDLGGGSPLDMPTAAKGPQAPKEKK